MRISKQERRMLTAYALGTTTDYHTLADRYGLTPRRVATLTGDRDVWREAYADLLRQILPHDPR